MNSFGVFFSLGFEHISDLQGYDHLLFIITLCAVYQLKEWRKVLILLTAFTVGHSLTLALSALNLIGISPSLVEFLIPITIFLTAIHNVIRKAEEAATFSRSVSLNYFIALFFGLIHGMGFSTYFLALMMDTNEVIGPLFSFNLGLEIGQFLIVCIFFTFLFVLTRFVQIVPRESNLFISGAGAGVSLILILEKIIDGS